MTKKDYKSKFFRIINKRMVLFQGFVTLIFLILLANLFVLQVLDLNEYKLKGIDIRSSKSLILRGDILDRNGVKLATDELDYEVYAHPRLFSAKYPPEKLARLLAPELKMSEKELISILKSKKFSIITVKKHVDRISAENIKKLGLREISVEKVKRRLYPQGNLASHILGYYSYLSQNSTGIENIANTKLEGDVFGKIRQSGIQHTANGDIIFGIDTDVQSVTKRVKCPDTTLTIDSAVQYICEKELAKTIKSTKADRGVVIVTDVTNGEILAYASYPDFNPNRFWKFSQTQLKNWSLTDVYPPGSTFKIVTVATALDLGVLNEASKVYDSGTMVIDKHQIKNNDVKIHPHPGMISLEYLFEHSSNVGSANIALMLDKNSYYAKLRDFGFGQATGIDLTAESIGILPKPEKWYKSKHASMGYGYGASVTAIQMISAVSAIANGGIWITPHVIKYSPEELSKHVIKRRVISEQTSKSVTKLLSRSIANGKTPLNLDKYTTCAKTGTSRKDVRSGKYVYASAIGYIPASNPKIAIYVVIDSPKTGVDYGGTIASPLFRKIATDVGTMLNIPSDKVKQR